MKKVIIDFVVSQNFGSDNTSFAFGGDCVIREEKKISNCSKTILMDDHIDAREVAMASLRCFRVKHKCRIENIKTTILGFPIYNPQTDVDRYINAEWKKFDVSNVQLILDAYFSKFENECKRCNIQPINNLNVYAEQMLNQILTDENQREVFYKFVVG